MINGFQSMLLAVELFSSSTNLSVILNDSSNVINVKTFGAVMVILKLYTTCSIHLHFIQHFAFFQILLNHFCVCAIIMTPNFTCSLIDCYWFLYFLSRDIHEGVLVN